MSGCVFLVNNNGRDVYVGHLYWRGVLLAEIHGSRAFICEVREQLAPSSAFGPGPLLDALCCALQRLGVPGFGCNHRNDHWLFAGQEPSCPDAKNPGDAHDSSSIRDALTGLGSADNGSARVAVDTELVDAESSPPSSKSQTLRERI